MPLHRRNDIRDALLDDVYASSDLAHSLPKYRMQLSEQTPRHAHSPIHDELMMDGNARQILGRACLCRACHDRLSITIFLPGLSVS